MRKTLLLIGLFVIALVLVACNNEPEGEGGGDDRGSDAAQPEQTEETDDGGDTASAADGEEVYQQSCATCHGDDLEGANGPALDTVGADMSKDEILNKIEEGGSGMPAAIVEGDDADAVAEWLTNKE